MKKSDLIARIARRQSRLHAHDIEKVVNTVLDEIASSLAQGNRVELRGFGAFTVRERKARTARNPKSGEPLNIATKRAPFFKAGRDMRVKLNETQDECDRDPIALSVPDCEMRHC